jgi:hypothetical protein
VTSGAYFGLRCQPGTFIYLLDDSTSIFAPIAALDTSVYVYTHSPPSVLNIIGIPSYDNPHVYAVAYKDGSLSEYMEDILSAVPETTSSSVGPL